MASNYLYFESDYLFILLLLLLFLSIFKMNTSVLISCQQGQRKKNESKQDVVIFRQTKGIPLSFRYKKTKSIRNFAEMLKCDNYR